MLSGVDRFERGSQSLHQVVLEAEILFRMKNNISIKLRGKADKPALPLSFVGS